MEKFRVGHKVRCIKEFKENDRILFIKDKIYKVVLYDRQHFRGPVVYGEGDDPRIINYSTIQPLFTLYKKELLSETDYLDAFKENESRYYE